MTELEHEGRASIEKTDAALGIIHQTWRCVPDQVEDYISNPKPNGYRSIHTVVIGPGNVRVEIQIRTEEMDQIAENGVAAHWRYKNEAYGFDEELAASTGLDAREATRSLLEIAGVVGSRDAELDDIRRHRRVEAKEAHDVSSPAGEPEGLPTSRL